MQFLLLRTSKRLILLMFKKGFIQTDKKYFEMSKLIHYT